MAMYSGGLALLAMGIPLKRWLSAILIAAAGALLIVFNSGALTELYTNFLLLLSYWIVPWFCIMYYDHWIRGIKGQARLASSGWVGVAVLCLRHHRLHSLHTFKPVSGCAGAKVFGGSGHKLSPQFDCQHLDLSLCAEESLPRSRAAPGHGGLKRGILTLDRESGPCAPYASQSGAIL
jgi:hypothetical protein